MKLNKKAIIAACAIILSSTSLNTFARSNVDVGIFIGSAPPPVRYESMPPPRAGNVWVPGYWNWNGRRHTWVNGHWERARPGYVYVNPSWQRTDRGWHLSHGEWRRGRDNYHDRHNGYDRHRKHENHHRHNRDRDRDGVPNRFDSHPHNPHRH